ncbi:aldo/keto reductase [Algoriphagus sp. A40]|uniref:aldo/keto reductase n=1 Tax=Algoriphagus sp. A40 TaxID=1945863 RepID=UPI000986BF63|nr:aldo/keto reductase [Algoriphagus sp. A40]OOG77220.1 oxidoreductase [Algoriphagus sp. A40]
MSELSRSGILPLPEIALGCMSLPENFSEAEKILHKALDSGITFFDTADMYQKGKSEDNLGRALKAKRSQVLISTKVGNQWNSSGTAWSWNPRKAYILKAIEESLKRLRTDYLDLYQLHGGTLDDPWQDTLEAFEILKEQGKICAFGISSIRPNVIRKVMAMNPPATIMMQYNPLDRRPEEEVFPLLEKTETRVLVRGALAKGILLDKPLTGFLDIPKEKVAEIKAEIHRLGFSPEAVLIRYGLMEKAIGSLVIGASSIEQVEKITKGYEESQAVPDELIQELKRKFSPNLYQDHR